MERFYSYSHRIFFFLVLFLVASASNMRYAIRDTSTLAPHSNWTQPVENLGANGFVFNVIKGKDAIGLAQGSFSYGFVTANKKEPVLDVDVSTIAVRDILELTGKTNYSAEKVSENIKKDISSKLLKAKKFLLQDSFFSEEDLIFDFEIEFNVYQAGLLEKDKNKIYLNWHSFKNQDFLNIALKNQLARRKLQKLIPDIHPAVRDLYSLFSVNIKEFVALKERDKLAAYNLLKTYQQLVNQNTGLIPIYKKILNEASAVDTSFSAKRYGAYFKYLCEQLPVDEDSLMPLIKEKLQHFVTVDTANTSIHTGLDLQMLWQYVQLYVHSLQERKKYRQGNALPLLQNYLGEMPKGLEVLRKWYGDRIAYQKLTPDILYLKVRFEENGIIKYCHIVLDITDDISKVLGNRGKIFGVTFDNWKQKRQFAFSTQGSSRDRSIRWSYLTRLPITKMIKQISETQEDIRKNTEIAKRLFEYLGISQTISQKTWLQLWKQMRKTPQANIPGEYVNLNMKLNDYLNKQFPLLFMSKYNFQYQPVNSLPIWPVVKDSQVDSQVVTWMHPRSGAKDIPYPYFSADKQISFNELLTRLAGNTNRLTRVLHQAA